MFARWNFICCCELCQDEEINDDNASYERFKILEEEAEKMDKKQYTINFHYLEKGNCGSSECLEEKYELLLKWIACHKQMYNLARAKRASKSFILAILTKGFGGGVMGLGAYENNSKLDHLKEELGKLAEVAHQISKMLYGVSSATKEWEYGIKICHMIDLEDELQKLYRLAKLTAKMQSDNPFDD